ncbi:MAG: TetR/AcrR family transcriptional regulator [Caldiserica bacterium]|jgi:AcrR family transcriptional regulator|nr:TetR/AcrR family transcriptional regulator [Caldisericota bacterium]
MSKNMKAQKAEETRSILLKEAENLFALRGYDAVSVDDICQAAGVSKGGFYHHFSSKEALFLELLDRWLSHLDEELLKIESSTSTVEEAIARMTDVAGYVIEQAEGSYGILFEFWNKARHEEKIWQSAVSYFERYRKFFLKILKKGRENGEFQPFDLELYSQIMVSLAVGVFLQAALDPRGSDWKASLRRMIGIILKELKSAQA